MIYYTGIIISIITCFVGKNNTKIHDSIIQTDRNHDIFFIVHVLVSNSFETLLEIVSIQNILSFGMSPFG